MSTTWYGFGQVCQPLAVHIRDQPANYDLSHCWFIGLWVFMLLYCKESIRYCLKGDLRVLKSERDPFEMGLPTAA